MNKIAVLSHDELANLNLANKFNLIYISDSSDWKDDISQVNNLKHRRNCLWIVADDIDDYWLANSGVQNNFRLINLKQISLIKLFISKSLTDNIPLIVSCNAGISRSASIGWYAANRANSCIRSEFLKAYHQRILPNATWWLLLHHKSINKSNYEKANQLRQKIFMN